MSDSKSNIEPVSVPTEFHTAKQKLSCDPAAGTFTWVAPGKSKEALRGKPIARCGINGYVTFRINRKTFVQHRLMFWWIHGWLPKFIDHINGIRSDNRIENLRPATRTQNIIHSVRKSKSPFRGVDVRNTKIGKRFKAQIRIDGRTKCLGTFGDAEQAARVYDAAARTAHGEFAVLNFP